MRELPEQPNTQPHLHRTPSKSGHPILTISKEHPLYPPGIITKLEDQGPATLWYRGTLLPTHIPWIAVVGSRAIDPASTEATRQICAVLAARGCAVISGGAMGVDAVAHSATLDAGGLTGAFFAGGVDLAGPKTNSRIFERMLARGGVHLSCQPPGISPQRSFYSDRNRLIAASVQAVIVIQAAPGSGTMITARHARLMNVPILAVPGHFEDQSRIGCANLIREGAHLISSVQQLHATLQELGIGEGLPLLARMLTSGPPAPSSPAPPPPGGAGKKKTTLGESGKAAPSGAAQAPLNASSGKADTDTSLDTATPDNIGKQKSSLPQGAGLPPKQRAPKASPKGRQAGRKQKSTKDGTEDPQQAGQLIAQLLKKKPLTKEEICRISGSTPWETGARLTLLELNGTVAKMLDGRYVHTGF